MYTVVMPKLGDTMEEGKILNWIKQEGDKIAKGDSLAEIETEKVNIEVEAFSEGTLRKILVPAGATMPIGAPIALIGSPSEPLPADATGGPSATATPPSPGSQANAAPEIIAPQPVAQPLGAEGHTEPEQPVAPTPVGAAPAPASNGYAPLAMNGAAPTSAPAQTNGRVFISPIARRIAAEHNLDIGQIPGTGPGGRIVRDDVQSYLASQQTAAQYAPVPQAQPAQLPAAAQPGEEVEAVPLSNMRRTIARRLQASMQTVPHFYVTVVIDTTKLGQFRASINDYAATLPEPVKVSYNDLIVKAAAAALTRFPQVNASFDGERLLVKKHVNVGIAVALEQGLIVPVVRDADKRGVLDIARESRRLAEAARAGKLKPEEFSGGTFSVSNLGMFDVEEFTAIINPPESAILAVGAIVPTPVVVDGQVTVRDRMKVTLSSDHRVLDGAISARFLQEIKRLLEEPMGLVL